MRDHYEFGDDVFERSFAEGSFPPELFTHEAHLRLAWIHIRKYGPATAIENVRMQIRAFANQHGDPGKYHDTLTIASVRAVYHFMLKSASTTFKEILNEFPRLKDRFLELLTTHYSSERLFSQEARSSWLEPDLAPFDRLGRVRQG